MALRDVAPITQTSALSLADLMLSEFNKRRLQRLAVLNSFVENLRAEQQRKKQRDIARSERNQQMALDVIASLSPALSSAISGAISGAGSGADAGTAGTAGTAGGTIGTAGTFGFTPPGFFGGIPAGMPL